MQFSDYLNTIAPEGETLLFVKQKPIARDGVPVLHGDGTPKYTWPAFLPSRARLDKPAAWYCNTGCFIVDRMADGPSASAANCERVAFMVLDDVGTKAKTPPIEPTWKIETSPGNFQWGYAFALDDQPLKGEFAAAIKAIADAGYSDPGACNPVRNFRLPGSLNLKPGRDNFAAVLTEFHPKREFSLPQLIAAFGVTPGPADTASFASIQLDDDGLDPVLEWVQAQGLLLDRANAEGWYGVVCPNHAAHTTGDAGGRYHPVTRAFTCFHGHCTDLNSEAFLRWVEGQGGPKCGYGLRDDLLATRMNDALSKIQPTEAFPDEAARVVAEVERKSVDRLTKAEWYQRFAYVQTDDAYFDLQERRELARSTFNALFRHVGCKSIHNGRRIEASICFDENRQAMGAPALVGITFAAGESVLVARNGDVYANRWRDARPPAVPGDVSRWLKHLERMIPDEDEREHVLNVMAFKRQFPARKINHAILHAGKPGSGKDTLWAPFLWAIGGPSNVNVALVRNEELTSPWGYALESEVMVINELRQAEARDRRSLENSLKPIIAAPPELLPVQRKGLHPYDALNRLFVLAFSNERAAITLPSDDRRWFVLWSDANKLPAHEAMAIWSWYKAGGFEAIAAWLDARDVSAFNPGATPPMTEAKQVMLAAAMSSAEAFLVEQIANRQGEFARGVVASPFWPLCDRLQALAPVGTKIVQGALFHALREAGWIDKGQCGSADYPTRKHIFCAPGLDNHTKSDLRRMAEAHNPPFSIVSQGGGKNRAEDGAKKGDHVIFPQAASDDEPVPF